jgi:acetylglutamate kinase
MKPEMLDVLREALPYINRFQGRVFVVKIGGRVADDAAGLRALCEEIALLARVGIRVVVVHGGGPQASEMSRRLGFEPQVVEGRRITDDGALEVVKMVLAGKVNVEILSAIQRTGVKAVGLSGVDGRLVRAKRRPPRPVEDPETGRMRLVDYGHVGDIVEVDPKMLEPILSAGLVPVVTCLAADDQGSVFNVNADTMAAHVARAMGAEKLILAGDVDGYLDEDGRVVSRLTAAEVRGLQAAGKVRGGMAPKLEAALIALEGGVRSVHLVNGTRRNGLLTEVFTDEGCGTMIAG